MTQTTERQFKKRVNDTVNLLMDAIESNDIPFEIFIPAANRIIVAWWRRHKTQEEFCQAMDALKEDF